MPLRGRAAALVALAALEPGISRERAAQWLWPDAPSPRQNLRQQLLRFRQALGTELLAGNDQLSLAADVVLEPAPPGAVLLADEAADGSDWGLWLQHQRRVAHLAQVQPLRQALSQAEADGDLDAALQHALALVVLDTQEEAHHQALMRVHYLRSEPAAGLQAYQVLVDQLAARLRSRPAAASEQLVSLLRQASGAAGTVVAAWGSVTVGVTGGVASATASATSSVNASATGSATASAITSATPGAAARMALPVSLKRPPQMVGRHHEWAATLQAWKEHPAVLLQGEAGLGKSRLLTELLAALTAETEFARASAGGSAALPGFASAPLSAAPGTAAHPRHATRRHTLLHTAGRPGDAAAPYTTLSRLLQALSGDAQALDAHHRAALALLWAPVDVCLEPAGRAPGGGSQQPRRPPQSPPPGALQRAIAALLEHSAVHTVALDDLHFSDDATLDLVAGLIAGPELGAADRAEPAAGAAAHQAAHRPLRWLLASRPAEASSAAQRLVHGLLELQRLHTVTLTALDAEAVSQLVDSLGIPGLLSHAPMPVREVAQLQAPGSASSAAQEPTLAASLVRHTGGNPLFLLETLKLGLLDGSLLAGRLPHPQAVGSLIERRLRQLSPRAISLARVAAVAGMDFDVELAEHATATPAVELADAWSELEQAQVLRDNHFAHDLVCDAVLRTLPGAVARHLHGVAAGWLAERQAEPARVARHWLAAAQPQRALAPLMQAAQRAGHAVRPAEALALYESARAIHADNNQPAEEAAVLFKMTECLRLVEDAPQTQRVLDRLQAIAGDDADRTRGWLAASRLANETRHMDQALQHARQALACAQASGDADLIGRSRLQLAVVLGETMQGDEAQLHLEAARSWAQKSPFALRYEFHHCAALVAMHLENFPAAVQAFEHLLADPETQADAQDELQLQGNLAVALAGMGALRAALVCDERRRLLAARHDVSGVSQNYLELNAATLLLNLGRYREALAFLEQAEARAIPDQAMLHLRWATLMLHLGQHARALQHIALCEEAETVHPIVKLTAGLLRLQVQAAGGNPAPLSAALLARSSELAEQDRRNAAWVRRELACSEFAAPEQGLVHAEHAIDRAARAHLHGLRLAGHTLRMEHALALGDLRCARADVPLVLTLRESYEPTSLYRARVGWAVVRVLKALRDPQAHSLLAEEVAWVQQTARSHVPSAFRASFLERNPVNRDLLAASTQPRLHG